MSTQSDEDNFKVNLATATLLRFMVLVLIRDGGVRGYISSLNHFLSR